jgi:purine-nucleoside phosphorylase
VSGLVERLEAALQYVRARSELRPRLGLILGSGLAKVADAVEKPRVFEYSEIPGFVSTSVEGHAGRLLLGTIKGVPAAVLQGRAHYYESRSMDDVALPVYLLHRLGVETLVVTNAAGGINAALDAGDIMIIGDHLNLMGDSPLMGKAGAKLGPRFPSTRDAYDAELRTLVRELGKKLDLKLHDGVYAALSGPAYETDAELHMLATLGADAVGMSTVPEVLVARHVSMRVLGLSVIANEASPHAHGEPALTHESVQRAVEAAVPRVRALVENLAERLAQ